MPISDLTGTTWEFEASPGSERAMGAEEWTFNITFTSNENNYTSLYLYLDYSEGIDIYYNQQNVATLVWNGWTDLYGTPVWTSQNYRTLTITGGSDVGNSTLIEWLQANATQVGPAARSATLDLSTLQLTPGSYQIKAIAKASGFIDSEASSTVTYEVYGPCDTPIVVMSENGYTFNFSAVAHASSYILYAGANVIQSGIIPPPTNIDLRTLSNSLVAGMNLISIKAIGSGYYTDSNQSTALTYYVYQVSGSALNAAIDGSLSYLHNHGKGTDLSFALSADGINYILPQSVSVNGSPVAAGTTISGCTYTRTSDTTGTLTISNLSQNTTFAVQGEVPTIPLNAPTIELEVV